MVTRPFKKFKPGDVVRFTSADADQRYRLGHNMPDVLEVSYAEPDYVRFKGVTAGCYSYRVELMEGPW